jgi:hypothetical protein
MQDLTFRPRARGHFVCNQHPELGMLGKKAVNLLKNGGTLDGKFVRQDIHFKNPNLSHRGRPHHRPGKRDRYGRAKSIHARRTTNNVTARSSVQNHSSFSIFDNWKW